MLEPCCFNLRTPSVRPTYPNIIGVEATPFSTFPASYTISISENTTLAPFGQGEIKVGKNQGYLNPLDEHDPPDRRIEKWFNFTGFADHKYTFELSSSNNTFLSIEVYDDKLNFLKSDYGVGKILSVEITEYDDYIIVVGGNDTTNYPVQFTINVKVNPPPNYDFLGTSLFVLVIVLAVGTYFVVKGYRKNN